MALFVQRMMCTSTSDQKHPELHTKEMSVHAWPLSSPSHSFEETLCSVCSQDKSCAVRQCLLILAHAVYQSLSISLRCMLLMHLFTCFFYLFTETRPCSALKESYAVSPINHRKGKNCSSAKGQYLSLSLALPEIITTSKAYFHEETRQ